MEDKEVGELWRDYNFYTYYDRRWEVLDLIRKLVEARARYWSVVYHVTSTGTVATKAALRDFGIDPATWPPKKSIQVTDNASTETGQ